jgi:hypothetical protein
MTILRRTTVSRHPFKTPQFSAIMLTAHTLFRRDCPLPSKTAPPSKHSLNKLIQLAKRFSKPLFPKEPLKTPPLSQAAANRCRAITRRMQALLVNF